MMSLATAYGSTIELKTIGGLPSVLVTFIIAWKGGVAMATTRAGLASLNRWAMLLAVPMSPWLFWKSILRLIPSLKPLSARAATVPSRAPSRAGCETNWTMPTFQVCPAGAWATTEPRGGGQASVEAAGLGEAAGLAAGLVAG